MYVCMYIISFRMIRCKLQIVHKGNKLFGWLWYKIPSSSSCFWSMFKERSVSGAKQNLGFHQNSTKFSIPSKSSSLSAWLSQSGYFFNIYIYVTELFNEAFLILLNQEFLCNKYKEFHFRILDFNSNNNW